MAKRSVSYTMGGNPKNRMSNVLAGDDRTGGRGAKRNPSVVRASDPANAASGYGSGGIGAPVTRMAAYGKTIKDQSRIMPTAVQRASVPGGAGVMALSKVRMKSTANAPKATVTAKKAAPMSAPIKARVKPVETIRTAVREKLTPTRKSGPQMGLNRVTGNTTGFSSGTTTGKTTTKSGVATKTPMSSYNRTQQNAFNKGGVAGPSRGGGGSRSSGGGAKSSSGGGNTGRGDVGAGRRCGRG